jgi:hypothetical protein
VAGGGGYGEELSGSENAGNFLTSCRIAPQEGLCSMEEVSKYVYMAVYASGYSVIKNTVKIM